MLPTQNIQYSYNRSQEFRLRFLGIKEIPSTADQTTCALPMLICWNHGESSLETVASYFEKGGWWSQRGGGGEWNEGVRWGGRGYSFLNKRKSFLTIVLPSNAFLRNFTSSALTFHCWLFSEASKAFLLETNKQKETSRKNSSYLSNFNYVHVRTLFIRTLSVRRAHL